MAVLFAWYFPPSNLLLFPPDAFHALCSSPCLSVCCVVFCAGIWPHHHSGPRRGDVWVYSALKQPGIAGSDLVPFHKLSQWLMFSLLEPFEQAGIEFTDMELLTGLAEYRHALIVLISHYGAFLFVARVAIIVDPFACLLFWCVLLA